MKNISIILILIFIFSGLTNFAFAQCKQQLVYACCTCHDNFYLRDFNAKLTKTNCDEDNLNNWTVVLDKGIHYRFYLCTPENFTDKVIMTLYSSQNPEKTNPLGTTWNQEKDEDNDIFDFICLQSGLYYVSIKFKDEVEEGQSSCAVGILSFFYKHK